MHFNAFFSLVFDEFDAANPFFAGLGETDPTDDAGTICQAEPPVAHAEVLALNCNSEVATTSGGLENAAEGDATGRLPSVHGANLFPPNWTVPVHIPGVLPDSIFQNFPPPPPNLPPSSADNWKLAGIQHQQAAPSTVVSTSSPYEVSSLGVGRSSRTRTPCKCPVCEKVFTRKGNLTQHIKSKHDPNPPRYFCLRPGCTSRYVRKSDRNRHMKEKHTP